MTFGSDHYVPVLKIKQGEKHALADLSPAIRARVTPLLEIVQMNGKKTLNQHLDTAFKNFNQAVAGFARYFIDAREIAPEGTKGAAAVFAKCAVPGVAFTPVTGFTRAADVTAAMNASGRDGLALRVARRDFENHDVAVELARFVALHKIDVGKTDLLVDLGAVEDMVADGVAEMARAFLNQVPRINDWRTLSLIGSAFPMSMKHVDRDSFAYVDREDWLAWRDQIFGVGDVARVPTFGDCAIQHPKGVEGFDPIKMQASAAIRYALELQWLLVKGRGTKKSPPSGQFPKLAGELVRGAHKKQFAGTGHCAGCKMIDAATKGAPKLGSLTTWRRIGTAHHITTTVEAIQRLHVP